MSKLKLLFLLLLLGSSLVSQAQKNNFTVSGTIKAQSSGETLIGAVVKIKDLKGAGTVTNEYGFYSLTVPSGSYELEVSYIGYELNTIAITLDKNITQDVDMVEKGKQLNEVVVKSVREDANVSRTEMGVMKLDVKTANKLPVIMGERDILKTMTLMPGISSAGDGNSGFYVRGGGPDQNLILLDEAPVYNASHLLGFFSTFNSDAIKDVTVYKGTIPAEFGGRLSSVLDIQMNEGNNKKYHVSGGIGLISSKLSVEGPLQKGKSSFLISGRRTYADMFLKLSNNENLKNSKLYFYDLNAKVNYKINDKNRIYLSGYFGRDVLGFDNIFGFDWGNSTATLRWNHIVNSKLFSNTSAIFSDYRYNIGITNAGFNFDIKSKIQDWNLKQEFTYYANTKHTVKFGFNTIHHTIEPGNIVAKGANSQVNNTNVEDRFAWENAVFVADEWKVNEKIKLNYGLRATSFTLLGAGSFYTYDQEGNATDSVKYQSGEFAKTYFNLEPRVSINYMLTKESSIKAGYSRSAQYLHLMSNSTTGNPTDLWIPSSENVKPQVADQYTLGYYRNFNDNKYEFSAEVYYKDMQNQIDYKNGAQLNVNTKIESELLFGVGRAYGIELFFKKRYGRFNGWVGYTLSRTERKINGINNGDWYVSRYDRTHDVSAVAMYDLTKRWTISAIWVYNTGNAVTYPAGKYNIDGQTYFYYTERNASRMPAYHRLDLGATYTKVTKKGRESSWAFSIYNAYNRFNPFSIAFEQNANNPQQTQAVQTSLFGIVPSITYNFKF
ncbi:MAG: TonB-dependent receptor [Flavipsychrobacter sp.]